MRIRESKAKRDSLAYRRWKEVYGNIFWIEWRRSVDEPRAIFAGVTQSEGLVALRRANERAAREAELPPEGRNFQPHVTLARLRSARAGAAYLERQGRIEAELSGIANNILSFGLDERDQQSTHIHTFVR
jgi:hypothetical protein